MPNSDQNNDSPDWLDVLGIDDLAAAGSTAENIADVDAPSEAVFEQQVFDNEQTVVDQRSIDLHSEDLGSGDSGTDDLQSQGPTDDEPVVDESPDHDAELQDNDESDSPDADSEREQAESKGPLGFGMAWLRGDDQPAEMTEDQLAKEQEKALERKNRQAEDDARFEERKQRRRDADADDDDNGLNIPKGKVLAFLAGLGILYFAANFADVWITSRAEFEGEVSAAVVLDAAQYDGEPSGTMRGRLDRAAELYAAGAVEQVVVTGAGQEAGITNEAKSGYDYLREMAGIPDEDLVLEVQGATTYEQLAAASRILTKDKITDVVVVTDPYHARRSMLIASEVGLEPTAAITDNRLDGTRLFSESVEVSIGRLVTFRRFDTYVN